MKKNCLLYLPLMVLLSCNQPPTSGVNGANVSNESLPLVEVMNPIQRVFEGNLELTGSVVAEQRTTVHAMESGFVQRIHLDIGDRVVSNQILAQLANPELEEQLVLQQAQMASITADRKKAEAAIIGAVADFEFRQSNFKRLQNIYDKTPDLISIDELESAEAHYKSSEAQLEMAKIEPEIIEHKLKSAEARVNSLKIRIGHLKVRAPFSGSISQRFVDRGAFVQNALESPSASPLFEVIDNSKLRLIVDYPESDVELISVGTAVSIEFPELAGKFVSAQISRISAAMNSASKTLRVEVDLQKDEDILPGMYAKISVRQRSQSETLSISKQAITAIKNQNFVYLVRNGVVHRSSIELGLEDKDFIQIFSDEISTEDLVIVKGKALISEGNEVRHVLIK